jgi:beta-N-acetylhexosaminidase
MTDDLDMGAILNEYGFEETIRRAIGAGNDLAMICHRVPAIEEALGYLEKLPRQELDRALGSIARFKAKLVPPDQFSESAFAALNGEIWNLRVATLGEERAKELSIEDGKRSPVESY